MSALDRRAARQSSQNGGWGTWLIKWFARLLFIGMVVFLLAYFVTPQKWVADQEHNVVIVPEESTGFSDQIWLVQWSPKQHRAVIAELPAEFSVEVLGGYGKFPVRSIWPLLKLEKKSDQFIRAGFSQGLGVVVDEVWTSKEPVVFQLAAKDPKPDRLMKNLLDHIVMGDIHTSISWRDRIHVWWWGHRLRPDQIVVEKVSDPEGWLQQRKKLAFEMRQSECSIALLNTTGTAGVASRLGKVLSDAGLVVVRISDEERVNRKTVIKRTPAAAICKEELAHLQSFFPETLEITEDPGLGNTARAQISVELGKETN